MSLDLGITSIGYSVLEELQNDKYSLLDYGVSMFDKPTDKDGSSKKLLHSASMSQSNLYGLRKQRKQNLAQLFEEFSLGKKKNFLNQERDNLHVNKWELRAKKAFESKLKASESVWSIIISLLDYVFSLTTNSQSVLE
ncbi:MAG: hypothetical protein U9P71_01620 [Campylobacterota bacterium]|nr:hypothetical protein [Campylobacterota bacterium]